MALQLRLATERDIPQLIRLNNGSEQLVYRDRYLFQEILENGFVIVLDDTENNVIVAMTSAREIAPGYWYHGATINTLPVSLSRLLFVHSTAEAVRRINGNSSRLYGEINKNNPKLSRLIESARKSFWHVVIEPDEFMREYAYSQSPEPVVFVEFDFAHSGDIIDRAVRCTSHHELPDLVVTLPLVCIESAVSLSP